MWSSNSVGCFLDLLEVCFVGVIGVVFEHSLRLVTGGEFEGSKIDKISHFGCVAVSAAVEDDIAFLPFFLHTHCVESVIETVKEIFLINWLVFYCAVKDVSVCPGVLFGR